MRQVLSASLSGRRRLYVLRRLTSAKKTDQVRFPGLRSSAFLLPLFFISCDRELIFFLRRFACFNNHDTQTPVVLCKKFIQGLQAFVVFLFFFRFSFLRKFDALL